MWTDIVATVGAVTGLISIIAVFRPLKRRRSLVVAGDYDTGSPNREHSGRIFIANNGKIEIVILHVRLALGHPSRLGRASATGMIDPSSTAVLLRPGESTLFATKLEQPIVDQLVARTGIDVTDENEAPLAPRWKYQIVYVQIKWIQSNGVSYETELPFKGLTSSAEGSRVMASNLALNIDAYRSSKTKTFKPKTVRSVNREMRG